MRERQKKKVMHLLKTGGYSGAENVVITMIENMQQDDSDICYVSVSGVIDRILDQKKIRHVVLESMNLRAIQRVVNQNHPDILHAHDFTMSVLAACIHFKGILISHLHNNPPWLSKINIKSISYACAARRFHKVFGVSNSVFEENIFQNSLRNKSLVIGNPVDSEAVIKMASEADEYENCDVMFLGRLAEPKDPLRFIRIIDRCVNEMPSIHAYMIGQGELEQACEKSISQQGLMNQIELLGFKENPYGYLEHAKILCIPSRWEGFGLVVVEAFALGIPVIATPVGGLKHLVNDTSGLLTDDDELMKEEILRLLNDPKYYSEKSQGARLRATQLDNIDKYMDRVRQAYEER